MSMPATVSSLNPLTERETEVLQLIAEGHSNREIAERLVVTVDTVKWYNRQIFEKLGVKSRTQAAALARESGLLDDRESSSATPSILPKSNLPVSLTSFVGRGREVGEVMRLVREHRLVTLTGPAGTGKTRLAVEAASRMPPIVRDNVTFVDLARIMEASMLGGAVAGALGVQEDPGTPIIDLLIRALTHRPPLILLDNFEHILGAAPFVADLLAATSDLHLLITSREALRVYGEQEYPVPPLAFPEETVSEADLREYAAVDLFLQRAGAVRPNFMAVGEELPIVASICQRLDGLPLAIELAAARVKFLSTEVLLSQLETRLDALKQGPIGVPDRHRTLRAAIAWSYDLLDEEEQALFARLAVFRGGRSVEAVKEIGKLDSTDRALKGLESLVNKNLLVVREGPDKEARFVMLETIHEYAREVLAQRGETEEIHRRHAEYFADLVSEAEPATRGGPHQMQWLKRLTVEYENIRAALEWSLGGGDPLLGIGMVGRLGYFWHRAGYYADGKHWVSTALDLPVFPQMPPAKRADVLRAAAVVAFYSHDSDRGRQWAREAATLYESLADDLGMGLALVELVANSRATSEEYSEAMKLAEKGRGLLEKAGDLPGIADMDCLTGELARMNGEWSEAKAAYESSLEVARVGGDRLREGICLQNLGVVAANRGDGREAEHLLRDAIDVFVGISDPVGAIFATALLAGVLAETGRPERGALMMGVSDAFCEHYRIRHHPADEPQILEYRDAIAQRLDEETFQLLLEAGRAMTYEELIAFVLNTPGEEPAK